MKKSDKETDIVVFGAGGHSKVVVDAILCQGRYRVAGLFDGSGQVPEPFFGLPIFGAEGVLPGLGYRRGVVAIGDNWVRSQVAAKVLTLVPDFEFITVVHPSAQLGRDVEIGAGTVIMAGVCINAATKIEPHCIVNTRACIDHDGQLKTFVSVAPGATLGGRVRVGAYSAIGLGAAVNHSIAIGDHSVIGSGSVVVKNVASHRVAYGVPCREVRERANGEPYLSDAQT